MPAKDSGFDEEQDRIEAKGLFGRFRDTAQEREPRDLTKDILDALPKDAWDRNRVKIHWLPAGIAAGIAAALFIWNLAVNRPSAGEKTVSRALSWLASSQEDSGSWNPERWKGQENLRVGLTSLAALAFLGHDDEPLSGPYAGPIERSMEFILSQQDATGRFGPACPNMMYNHCIATVALLEAYGISGEQQLRAPLDKAIDLIRVSQTEKGGWGYQGLPGDVPNTSVSVWPLHALLLAQRMGWEDSGSNVRRGISWLESITDEQGLVGYTSRGDFPNGPETLTAIGSFYRSVAEPERADLRGHMPQVIGENRPAFGDGQLDFYRSYFLMAAYSMSDRSHHHTSGDRIASKLIETQVSTGPNAGSWEPKDQWSAAGGRVYSTAMAALSLESGLRIPRTVSWMTERERER